MRTTLNTVAIVFFYDTVLLFCKETFTSRPVVLSRPPNSRLYLISIQKSQQTLRVFKDQEYLEGYRRISKQSNKKGHPLQKTFNGL